MKVLFSAMIKWSLISLIPLLLAGGIFYYFSLAFQELEIKDVEIERIQNQENEMEFRGVLKFNNPSQFAIVARNSKYKISDLETDEVLLERRMKVFILEESSLNEVEFQFPLNNVGEEKILNFSLDMRLNLPGFKNHSFVFSKEFEVK